MRVFFFIAIFVIAALAFWGLFNYAYVDNYSRSRALSDNIIILIVTSLLVGCLFFIFFLKTFPKGWSKQHVIGKILLPLVFPILAFVSLRGIMLLINSEIGKQHELILMGIILEKKIEITRKRTKFYNVAVSDTVGNRIYELQVKRKVYESLGERGDGFAREFKIGSLGIIYRKEY